MLQSWNSWLMSCLWREWGVWCLLMRILFFKVRQPILDLMSGSRPSWCCVSVLFHLFPVKACYNSMELHKLLWPCSLCCENNKKKKRSKILTCSCEQPDPCAGSLAGSNSPSLQQCQPWSAADSDKEETAREWNRHISEIWNLIHYLFSMYSRTEYRIECFSAPTVEFEKNNKNSKNVKMFCYFIKLSDYIVSPVWVFFS